MKDESVEMKVGFSCANGHEIVRNFTNILGGNSQRLLDEQIFSLICSHCGWRVDRKGSERTSLFERVPYGRTL